MTRVSQLTSRASQSKSPVDKPVKQEMVVSYHAIEEDDGHSNESSVSRQRRRAPSLQVEHEVACPVGLDQPSHPLYEILIALAQASCRRTRYRRQSYGNPGVARSSARAPDPATPRYPDLDPGRSAFGSTTLAKDSSTKAYCSTQQDLRKEDQERKPPLQGNPQARSRSRPPDSSSSKSLQIWTYRQQSEDFHAAPTHSLVSPRRSRLLRTRTSLESPREQDPAHTDGYTR
ncbi:unnamed protein product [Phytophthora lilii]|uniref:Unnamed protein product n=1 Tax=Phytophthora lilii TaxID=2077276 RepID=A0A9W6TI94_9STRA|nr:unnamed protein product [Phytophthora lilii]